MRKLNPQKTNIAELLERVTRIISNDLELLEDVSGTENPFDLRVSSHLKNYTDILEKVENFRRRDTDEEDKQDIQIIVERVEKGKLKND